MSEPGPKKPDPNEPAESATKQVIENCNRYLRGEITIDEWEAEVKKILGEKEEPPRKGASEKK